MKPPKATDDQSDGEAAFAYYLRTIGRDLPPWQQYYEIPEGNRSGRPVKGEKNFEADFAWVEQRVLFEVQGHGHNNYFNYRNDLIRHNLLTTWGYRVFYGTPDQISQDAERLIGFLRSVLKGEAREQQ